MDLGNATYTQFNMNEDVAAYMADNIELFDCDLQLVHSHHSMPTSPSGTDLNTLREEGNDRNCFVSLIVNNAGNYYAAVTRKVTSKSNITINHLGSSYEFFGEGEVQIADGISQEVMTEENTVIEYFNLDVERHTVSNPLEYLDTRFTEILQKKSTIINPLNRQTKLSDNTSFLDWLHKPSPKNTEPYLFNNSTMKSLEVPKSQNKESSSKQFEFIPNHRIIHQNVVRMILCSFIVNPDKIDLKQWVKVHMKKKYEEIFHIENGYMDEFTEWKDFIIDYTLNHYEELNHVDYENWEEVTFAVVNAILEELEEFRGLNVYIDNYIQSLEQNLW